MALPLTDSDLTVVAPEPENASLTPVSTVGDAWRRLVATGDASVVVMRDERPVAVATRQAVGLAMACGDADAPLGTVADHVAVPVDRTADALDTLHAFTQAAWDWLRIDRRR